MSAASLVVFLALVALVCSAFLAGVWRSSPRLDVVRASVGLGLWLAATGALARSGVLSQFDRTPPPSALFLLALTASTVALAVSSIGARLAAGVPLAALVGVQAFRIPLEVLLHRLHLEGVLPVQMTYAGWNGDILTGLLAIPLAVALWRGQVSATWVHVWNAVGLGLLAVVVVTAVLSLPTPFQRFTAEPSTRAIATMPLVWLPAVLVQAAFLGHLLVLRRLRADRRRASVSAARHRAPRRAF